MRESQKRDHDEGCTGVDGSENASTATNVGRLAVDCDASERDGPVAETLLVLQVVGDVGVCDVTAVLVRVNLAEGEDTSGFSTLLMLGSLGLMLSMFRASWKVKALVERTFCLPRPARKE